MPPFLPPRPPAPPPPPPDRPSPPLAAQIDRDFGSLKDFQRALEHMCADRRHGGNVWLICTPQGRLRLVHTPPGGRPLAPALCRIPLPCGPQPPRPDWLEANRRYDGHMASRPPYPMP